MARCLEGSVVERARDVAISNDLEPSFSVALVVPEPHLELGTDQHIGPDLVAAMRIKSAGAVQLDEASPRDGEAAIADTLEHEVVGGLDVARIGAQGKHDLHHEIA